MWCVPHHHHGAKLAGGSNGGGLATVPSLPGRGVSGGSPSGFSRPPPMVAVCLALGRALSRTGAPDPVVRTPRWIRPCATVKLALPKRELGIPTTVSPPGPLVLMFVPRLSVAPKTGLPVMVSAAMITGVTGGGGSAAAGAAADRARG